MAYAGGETKAGERVFWLDNLRTTMVFLVVLAHGLVVYEKYEMGADWWIVVDPGGTDFHGILFLILNIFVIATIFFIAGYLTPASVQGKSAAGFIRSKLKRLMLPWGVAVFALLPAYKALFLMSRGLPQEPWINYFHWNNVWSQNWLWFLPVLFLFDLLYLGLARLPVDGAAIRPRHALIGLVLAAIVYSFGMDYFEWEGWTKSPLLDFQNERLLIYFLAYLFGALCFKQNVFTVDWPGKKLDIVLHGIGWLPVNLYLFLLIYGLVKPDDYLISRAVDILLLRTFFVLSLAYLVYAMLSIFKRYVNGQGRIHALLNANSYSVYIIHVVVLGVFATLFAGTSLASPLKLLLVVLLTYLTCNVLVTLYRAIRTRLLG